MPSADDLHPCTICGEPLLWGTRHGSCYVRERDAIINQLAELKASAVGIGSFESKVAELQARARRLTGGVAQTDDKTKGPNT
jgi:hypothetical protein